MKSNQPFFSVVIPTYARPKQLEACLRALTQIEYPFDRFEVVVVDDGGEVALEPVVTLFQKTGIEVIIITQKNAGPATARNTGAARAKGEFLAFTDDDCMPATDWLKNLATRFITTRDQLIGGQSINGLPKNLYSTASQLITDAVYAYYNHSTRAHFFASNNMALRTELFRDFGGFNTTFPRAASEDREFCDRWLKQGYQMTYAPEVVVYHAHALTFRRFCRQHFNYGRGACHLHQLKADSKSDPIKFDVFFYLSLFKYPFQAIHSWKAFQFAFLIFVQQTCKTIGFFWEKLSK